MIAGLLLAAGAGVRAGGPKALRRFEDGVSWLERSAIALRDGGCEPVLVVVGARAGEATALVPGWARAVVAPDWAEGMGASLRAGLRALMDDAGRDDAGRDGDAGRDDDAGRDGDAGRDDARRHGAAGYASPEHRQNPPVGPQAVVIGLVDTPGVTAAVVARLIGHASPSTLARAAYRGEPGHPVLIGRDHWAGAISVASGDQGARSYLAGRQVELVECADLGSGEDRDAG